MTLCFIWDFMRKKMGLKGIRCEKKKKKKTGFFSFFFFILKFTPELTHTLLPLWSRRILKDLASAYGHMILRDGHFQADPHPGNILVCKGGKVITPNRAACCMLYEGFCHG